MCILGAKTLGILYLSLNLQQPQSQLLTMGSNSNHHLTEISKAKLVVLE